MINDQRSTKNEPPLINFVLFMLLPLIRFTVFTRYGVDVCEKRNIERVMIDANACEASRLTLTTFFWITTTSGCLWRSRRAILVHTVYHTALYDCDLVLFTYSQRGDWWWWKMNETYEMLSVWIAWVPALLEWCFWFWLYCFCCTGLNWIGIWIWHCFLSFVFDLSRISAIPSDLSHCANELPHRLWPDWLTAPLQDLGT